MRRCCGGPKLPKERPESLALALAVAPTFQRRSVKRAFAEWRAAILLELSEAEAALLARAAACFQHAACSRGWSTWRLWLWDRKEQLLSLRQSVGHLSHRQAAKAVNGWIEAAGSSRALKQRLRQATGRLQHRSLAAAWRSWADYLEHVASDPMAMALTHLLHRQCAAALRSLQDLLEQKQLLRRSVGFFSRSELTKGWTSWHGRWAAAQAQQSALSSDGTVGIAIRRIQRMRIARAWTAWEAAVVVEGNRVLILMQCVRLLSQHALGRGWRSWAWQRPSRWRCSRRRQPRTRPRPTAYPSWPLASTLPAPTGEPRGITAGE